MRPVRAEHFHVLLDHLSVHNCVSFSSTEG
jgi:hypothetical protein